MQIYKSPKYSEIISKITKDGPLKLHIVLDFDRTLTYGSINGKKTLSIIAMLRDGNHLTGNYSQEAEKLFAIYMPFEQDLKLSIEERKYKMMEWWSKHFELLIKSGLTLKDIEDVVRNGQVKLRGGVKEFADILKTQEIPLVIISASGCGDAIPMYFQEIGNYSNIHYIVDRFKWDESGNAVSIIPPIIHSLNKDETVISQYPDIFKNISNRKNVILLGDGIDDIGMVKGFDYENLLKIGFLNYDYERNINKYKENFDVFLSGDGDFSDVVDILKELISK